MQLHTKHANKSKSEDVSKMFQDDESLADLAEPMDTQQVPNDSDKASFHSEIASVIESIVISLEDKEKPNNT